MKKELIKWHSKYIKLSLIRDSKRNVFSKDI